MELVDGIEIDKAAIVDRSVRVRIRRQWNDHRIGSVLLCKISDLHWSEISGGTQVRAPRPFLHGYVSCADVEGEIAHSCEHGEGPHRIKVCLVKKDNDPKVFERLLEVVGQRPE